MTQDTLGVSKITDCKQSLNFGAPRVLSESHVMILFRPLSLFFADIRDHSKSNAWMVISAIFLARECVSNKERKEKKKVLPFSFFSKKRMERKRKMQEIRRSQRQEERMRQRKERKERREGFRKKYNLPKSRHLTVQ